MSARPSRSAWAFTGLGAGHDHDADALGDVATLEQRGRLAQVADAAVGAGADEDDVHLVAQQRLAGLQVHVVEGLLERAPAGVVRAPRPGRGRAP